MHSDNADKDIRTLSNGTCQFWSLLTAIGINELHRRIDETFSDSSIIQVTSSIYDSIYGICLADPEVIEWLNNNIVEILCKDFMIDQTVHNDAQLELGSDWATLHPIPHSATIDEITTTLGTLNGKTT